MAFGVPTNLGSANVKTGTTLPLTLATTVSAGSLVVVTVGSDNTSATDVATKDDIVGVTDSKGNVYVLAAGQTNGQTGAQLGAHGSIWYSNITTALASGDTITLTNTTTNYARCFIAASHSMAAGFMAQVAGTASGVGDAGVDPSAVISGLTSAPTLYVGVSSDETTTGAGAFTGFTRLAIGASTGGSAASNIAISHQYAIETSTTKTFTPATAVDAVAVLVAFREVVNPNAIVAAPGVSATGTAGTVTVTANIAVSTLVTGVSATGSAGDVAVTTAAVASVTGVQSTGAIGAVTVNVPSSTGPWTPAELTTGQIGWYDAADASKLLWSGPNLTTWVDKSPAGRNAFPKATGPTATTVNGLGSLWFNTQPLITPAAVFGDFITFAVWTPRTGAFPQYERIMDLAYDTGWWLGRDAGQFSHWGGGVQDISAPYGIFISIADGSTHLISNERNGTVHTIKGDGGAVSVNANCSGSATPSLPIYIGDDNGGTAPLGGSSISEILIYNATVLSADDQAKMEGYLAWKWGIQANLPAAHPYKSAPPAGGGPPSVSVSVPVTGVAAIGAVGAVTVAAKQAVSTSVTGVAATGAVGTVTVAAKQAVIVPAIGVSAAGSVGNVTVAITPRIDVTVPVGGVPFVPTDIAGMTGWFDASDAATITVTGSGVSSWGNKAVPASFTLTQSADINRPIYGSNAVTFTTPQVLAATAAPTTYDFLLVGKPTADTSNWRTALHNSDGYNTVLLEQGTNNFGSYNAVAPYFRAAGTWVAAAAGLAYGRVGSGPITFSRDGGALVSTTITVPVDKTVLNFVGGYFGASGGGQGWGGINELFIIPYNSSDDVRQKLEGYAAWKWSLASLLPVDHPYKSAPPGGVPVPGMTGAIGSVTVAGKANVSVPGVAANGVVGSVSVSAGGSVSAGVSGVQALGTVGSVTVTAKRTVGVPVTGVQAAGAVGSVSVITSAISGIGVWNGSAWVDKPAKVWSGTAWVTKPVKVWNGSAWV